MRAIDAMIAMDILSMVRDVSVGKIKLKDITDVIVEALHKNHISIVMFQAYLLMSEREYQNNQ